MAKTIVWTRRAIQSFDRVIGHLKAEWGHKVASAFVQRSFRIIELLADNPAMGTEEVAEKNIRGFVITRHNRLFYRVTEHSLILLSFFDTRSGPMRKRF